MRILMVANGAYPDEIGGAHVYVYELARSLAGRGHEAVILTRRIHPGLPREELVGGVRFVRYAYRDVRNPILWRLNLYRAARRGFAALARRERFDVLHAHWPYSAAGAFSVPAAAPALRVYTMHSPSFEEELIEAAECRLGKRLTLRELAKRLWMPLSLAEKKHRESRVLRQCSIIFVLSEFMKKRAIGFFDLPEERLRVIPGGVDVHRFRPDGPRDDVRRRLGVAAGAQLLFTVRRLVPRMGLKNLLRAVAIVREAVPRVLLCVGGSGVLGGELDALIGRLGLRDHVRLLGHLPAETLPDWYRAADYCVMPTEFLEGFGIASVESMACGTPVLATPVGGNVEVLGGIDPGLLFSGTSPEEMAEGIIRHLRSGSGEALRERVARHVRERYTWESIARRIEDVLLKQLERQGAHGAA